MGTSFYHALLNPELEVPEQIVVKRQVSVQNRFNVYRNNVVSSLIDALCTRFPMTLKLVGEEFFRAMAAVYVRQKQPSSPIMMFYGDDLSAFIAQFEPLNDYPYLADVAAFEALAAHAFHAQDGDVLSSEDIQHCGQELVLRKLRLHPSVRLLQSNVPFFSVWRAQKDETFEMGEDWYGEFALVCRPQLDVFYMQLSEAEFDLICAIDQHKTLGEAVEACLEKHADLHFSDVVQNVLLKPIFCKIGSIT